MFDVNTLDPKKVTFAGIETVGTKFIGYEVLNYAEIYEPAMSENIVRKDGLNMNNLYNITQSFSKGIDYSEMPPAVYKKSQIVDGVHYKYVLLAGHHRFKAISRNNFDKWVFGIYELAKDGFSFEDSLTNFQLCENDKLPQLESSDDDVINTVSRLINHGSKLVENNEDSIRNYVDKVCSNKHWQTKAKIVRGILRACGTYQDVVTYTSEDAFKWIENNTDFTYAGDLDVKRKKYGWTVKEGYEYEYIMSAAKKFLESNRESYFICHTKAPTERNDLNDKRENMLNTFQYLENALEEVFDFYQKHGRFPWKVQGFLPQNHQNDERELIEV